GTRAAAGGHTDHHVRMLSPTPVQLRQVVDDLVETAGDEVGELHFHHTLESAEAQAQANADNGAFAKRRIAHAVPAEFIQKALCDLENAAVIGNVLPHQDQVGVPAHGFAQSVG